MTNIITQEEYQASFSQEIWPIADFNKFNAKWADYEVFKRSIRDSREDEVIKKGCENLEYIASIVEAIPLDIIFKQGGESNRRAQELLNKLWKIIREECSFLASCIKNIPDIKLEEKIEKKIMNIRSRVTSTLLRLEEMKTVSTIIAQVDVIAREIIPPPLRNPTFWQQVGAIGETVYKNPFYVGGVGAAGAAGICLLTGGLALVPIGAGFAIGFGGHFLVDKMFNDGNWWKDFVSTHPYQAIIGTAITCYMVGYGVSVAASKLGLAKATGEVLAKLKEFLPHLSIDAKTVELGIKFIAEHPNVTGLVTGLGSVGITKLFEQKDNIAQRLESLQNILSQLKKILQHLSEMRGGIESLYSSASSSSSSSSAASSPSI